MTRFQFFLTRWYVFTKSSAPWWSSACPGEGAYPPRSSNQSVSTRRAQLSIAAEAIRPTELLNHVKTWVNTRKAFSSYSTPLGVVTVRLYVGSLLSDCPPLCCGKAAPQVSEEECSYALRFYHWFLESSKSCLLLLVALPGLIDTLAQLLASRSLLWLSMTWQWRYLTQ